MATAVPLAKNWEGPVTLRVTVFKEPHAATGMFFEVVKANTADCWVPATRFAKGMVIETAVMVP